MLDVGEQPYGKQKYLLLKSFAITLTQKYEDIKKLTELKLAQSGDPSAFVASMRTAGYVFCKA